MTPSRRGDGDDVGWCASDHLLCFGADGEDFLAVSLYGHPRRLVDDDTFPPHVDQCIGRAEINTDVEGKKPQKGVNGIEH